MTQKIVIGWGFGLNEEIKEYMINQLGSPPLPNYPDDIERDNPYLVQAVLMGKNNGYCLHVIEIPDGIEWQIEEYDSMEWVAEKHRKWDKNGEMT